MLSQEIIDMHARQEGHRQYSVRRVSRQVPGNLDERNGRQTLSKELNVFTFPMVISLSENLLLDFIDRRPRNMSRGLRRLGDGPQGFKVISDCVADAWVLNFDRHALTLARQRVMNLAQ